MELIPKYSGNLTEFSSRLEDTILISGWLIGKAEKTKKTYIKVIKAFFEYHQQVTIAQTTAAHITTFLKGAEKRGVKLATLNLYLNALSSLFRFAIKQRKIEIDPTKGLKNYRIQSSIYQKILYMDQIEQMLRKTKRPRDLLLIKVLFYLGLRVSEVTEILMSDFSLFRDGVILNVKGKGSKVRQMPISPELWKDIGDYVEIQGLRSSDFLFNDEKSRARKISTFAIWRAIRSAAVRAKVNPLPSPHWFRHTCATLSLDGGAPIHVVKERLGHASLSTTQIYLHASSSEGLHQYLPTLPKP